MKDVQESQIPDESPLAEVLRLFGHKDKTFDLSLPTGKTIPCRVLVRHVDLIAHRNARSAWVSARLKGPGHARYERYYPIDEETLMGIFNIANTAVDQPDGFDLMLWELAAGPEGNAAVFEAMVQEWSVSQAIAKNAFENDAAEHLKND